MARSPLSPSTITLMQSRAVRPTRAMRRHPKTSTAYLTASAPVRVLPQDRPAQMIHTVQGMLMSSCWLARPLNAQLKSRRSLAGGERAWAAWRYSGWVAVIFARLVLGRVSRIGIFGLRFRCQGAQEIF